MAVFNVKPPKMRWLNCWSGGDDPAECALHLGVSITTIRTHLSALYRKNAFRNQSELLLIIRAIHG